MRKALSIVLTAAFSTMSVVACGSDTPTENGLTDVASVAVTPTNATLVSFVETAQFARGSHAHTP